MQIRLASPADLVFIEGAYAHARAFMQAHGNATQWPDGYPSRIDAEGDTRADTVSLWPTTRGLLQSLALRGRTNLRRD